MKTTSAIRKGLIAMGILAAAAALFGCTKAKQPAKPQVPDTASGTFSANDGSSEVTWSFDKSTKTLTISGKGAMCSGFAPWNQHGSAIKDSIKTVVIEEGITAIGKTNFYGMSNLSSVPVFPSTLERIGASAFYGNHSMSGELTFPEGLSEIGESAFEKCPGITGSLVFPAGLKVISNDAFCDCSGLDGSLSFPEGLESIGFAAFARCSKLTGSIILPDSLTEIGEYAFTECSGLNGSLKLSGGLKSIPEQAFYSANLTGDVIIPDSVETIGPKAFSNCAFNGRLVAGKDTRYISKYAFYKCPLSEIELNEGLILIGTEAFKEAQISSLKLPKSLGYIGEAAFADCEKLSGKLELPEGLDFINNFAFLRTAIDAEIDIPESVSFASTDAFNNTAVVNFQGVMPAAEDLILPELSEANAAGAAGSDSSSGSGSSNIEAYQWRPFGERYNGMGRFGDIIFYMDTEGVFTVCRNDGRTQPGEVLAELPGYYSFENTVMSMGTDIPFIYKGVVFKDFIVFHGYGRANCLMPVDADGKPLATSDKDPNYAFFASWNYNNDDSWLSYRYPEFINFENPGL